MITTDRLTLRAPQMADAPVVTAALQDFDVARWLTGPPYPYTLTHAQDFIRRDHDGKVFYIEDDGGVCGAISLTEGLGYWLSKDRWGRGYMTEAARAVIEYHFEESDAPDLMSGYMLENSASRRILVRFGFQDAFVKAFHVPALGRKVDVQKMSLSRTDWDARA